MLGQADCGDRRDLTSPVAHCGSSGRRHRMRTSPTRPCGRRRAQGGRRRSASVTRVVRQCRRPSPVGSSGRRSWSAFAAQYLNQWPATVEPASSGESLLDLAAWQAVDVDVLLEAPLVIVVEDNYGTVARRSPSPAISASDPRVHVEAELYETRAEALERAGETVRQLRDVAGARRRLPDR